jgi:hypothetical protein
MNGRERILAALRRQEVDYVPCAPFLNPQDWPQRVGRRWQFPFGPSTPETLEYMVRVMGVDHIVGTGFGYHPDPAVSARVWLDGEVLHKRYDTPSGELHAAIRATPSWPHGFDIPFFTDYNPGHFVEPWVKTVRDVACLAHVVRPPSTRAELDELRFGYAECRRLAAEYGMPVMVSAGMGLTAGLQVFGPLELCEKSLSDPGLVEAFLDVEERLGLAHTEIALDLGADIIRRNGFYETTDFYSPAQLEGFLAARLAKQIRMVHEAGRVIGYTALSGVTPMLGHLAALDFDCLFTPDFHLKGMDGPRIVRALEGRYSFWTGPSDTIHMPYDDAEAVRGAVRTTFRTVGRRGLILGPCSSAKAVFPWSSVVAMVDEWKVLRS